MKRSALPLVLGVRSRPKVLEAEIAAGLGEGLRSVAGAIVGHDARDRDAEAGVVGHRRLEEVTQASSMQTWTYSQPTPRGCFALRSPVMRWPSWLKRPSPATAGRLAFQATVALTHLSALLERRTLGLKKPRGEAL